MEPSLRDLGHILPLRQGARTPVEAHSSTTRWGSSTWRERRQSWVLWSWTLTLSLRGTLRRCLGRVSSRATLSGPPPWGRTSSTSWGGFLAGFGFYTVVL